MGIELYFGLSFVFLCLISYVTWWWLSHDHVQTDLVVAACKEDLAWVDDRAHLYRTVYVYDKCGRNPTFKSDNVVVKPIKNVGSCDNAYLTHIVKNHDSLPDVVHFRKGKCIPHTNDTTFTCASCHGRNDMLTFYLNDHTFANNPSQKYVPSAHANMGEWVRSTNVISTDAYNRLWCNVKFGGNFSASREQIKQVPLGIYKTFLSQQKHANEEVDHYIERTWGVLFCAEPGDFLLPP